MRQSTAAMMVDCCVLRAGPPRSCDVAPSPPPPTPPAPSPPSPPSPPFAPALRPVDINGDGTNRRRTSSPCRPDDSDSDEGSPARRRNAARTASDFRSISSGDDARDATAMRPVGRPRRCLGGTMTTVPGTRWGGGDGDGSDGGDYRGGAERSGAGWGGSGRDGVVRRWCSLSLIEKIMMVSLTTRRACIFLSLAFGCPSLAKLDPSARRPARI